MTQTLAKPEPKPETPTEIRARAIETVVAQGDLSKLNASERVLYYHQLCASLGLNPLTRPFEYLTLQGKLVLYARKDCTDQLRTIHGVSITNVTAETVGDLYVVTARAQTQNGRVDADMGAVSIAGLKGDALVNAMLKATTKAKRRVTLSICGLGLNDETEVETIPGARYHTVDVETGEVVNQSKALPPTRDRDVEDNSALNRTVAADDDDR